MTLEDHVGDIVAKARTSAGINLSRAAEAAGIAVADLETFEAQGCCPRVPDYVALGDLLGLDGKKLAGIAEGWTPAKADLSVWRELRCVTTDEGGMAVNAFLVWDEVTLEAAVFDTGWRAEPLLRLIAENHLNPRHLFITHTHQDHIAALGEIRQHFPRIKLHSSAAGAPLDQRNRSGDFIHLGSLRITNRDTPGHAEDGVSYVVGTWPEDAPNVVVVGDAVFAGSMGGARQQLSLARQKVREQILSLPGPTLICPGHGPLTTVAEEQAQNPFF